MMQVDWRDCEGNVWCSFMNVNLDFPDEGVYFIWDSGRRQVIYVGQGRVADRIAAHRSDPAIQKYNPSRLFVTWAKVPVQDRNGIERYLADYYGPLEGEQHPQAAPIPVNLP